MYPQQLERFLEENPQYLLGLRVKIITSAVLVPQ